ncbi:MAG: nuclear transport factor 2 family protein [Archangium sp.]|nr:nuclear transport factor 2 family protein [Archangium sp.]
MSTPPLISEFFRCMQAGASSADAMLALFTDDAVYVEPFSGVVQTHRGVVAIRAAMSSGWERPLPEMRLTVDRVDLDGATVRAEWTCRSPALPGGAGRGVNVFTLVGGRIARLETTLVGAAP